MQTAQIPQLPSFVEFMRNLQQPESLLPQVTPCDSQQRAIDSTNAASSKILKQGEYFVTDMLPNGEVVKNKMSLHVSNGRKIVGVVKQQFKCHSCKTTQTSERRRGPNGPHTLCNRCGLRWARQQRDKT